MLTRLLVVAFAAALTSVASAATFNVTTPAEFQTALTTAQANGESDTINVAAGTYNVATNGTLTYTAVATENFGLTVTGGVLALAVLDGGMQVPILRIDSTAVINDGGVSFQVENLTFRNGNAVGTPDDGGALAILTDESLQPNEFAALIGVTGSEFFDNRADDDGGAIYIRGHAVEGIYLSDLTVDGNQAGGDGGGAYVAGGQFTTSVILSDIDFFDNIAAGNGGGLNAEGFDPNTPSEDRTVSVSMFDMLFYNNESQNLFGGGGGADVAALDVTVEIVGFVDNLAANEGGGLRIRQSFTSLLVVNSGFVGNTANDEGGGLAAAESIFATVTLTNNTFTENAATSIGGGAFIAIDGDASIARIYNNIIWGNLPQGVGEDLYLENNALGDIPGIVEIFNNDIGDFVVTPGPVSSGSNIDLNPMFVDIALRPEPDPRLQALSPAIDTGVDSAPARPSRDFEFDARPLDGDGDMTATTDIGMDEYVPGAVPEADLSVTRTNAPAPATGGEDVTMTVTVTNAGPDEATGVSLITYIDERATLVSAIFNQGNPCTSGASNPPLTTQVICELGTIAASNDVTGTIVITTPVVDVLTNLGVQTQVLGNENDPDGQNNFDDRVVILVPAQGPAQADLAVTKVDTPDPVISGGPTLTYDITVTNNGPDAATGVTVTDTVLMGLTIDDASSTAGSCLVNGLLVTCTIGDLAVDATETVTITVSPEPVLASTDFDNTADVTGNEADPIAGNNSSTVTTTVTPPESDMMVTVVATPSSPSIGETVTFDITIMNGGPSHNLGIDMSITLPTMGTFQTSSISQGLCSAPTSGVIDCAIGDMLSGATVTAQVVFTAPNEAASMVLSASVAGSVTDPAGGNNTDSDAVSVVEAVDLIIQGKSKGTGTIGWLEMLLLAVAVAAFRSMRAARFAVPCLFAAIAALTLVPAGNAVAQGDWYVHGAIGRVDLDYSATDLTSDLSSLGWTISNPVVDSEKDAWKVFGGFAFNNYFAIEAGYVSLGEVMTQFGATVAPTEIDDILSDTLAVHPYQGDGWVAAAVVSWPISPDKFSLNLKAGAFRWDSETDVRVIQGGTGSVSGKDSGTDTMYGVGIEWKLNPTWALTAEWERYKLNEWLDVPSIGIKFRF